MFSGVVTALITPFRDGQLDPQRLKMQIDRQIAAGVDALVPVGTTGESPTLDFDEHEKVIALTVEYAAGRVPVIAGVGANATSEALRLHRFARLVGAAAGLSVNPYYNKPSQEGLYRHFMTLADSVDLPIVLYNIPGRCGVNMAPATVARLAEHPNIVAIKEAAGSVDQVTEIRSLCDLPVLSGDDGLTLPFLSVGAVGVVSVLSNLLPGVVVDMVSKFRSGQHSAAADLHVRLFPLIKALFADGNPAGVKAAMKLAGLDSGELRLPLVEPTAATVALLRRELERWSDAVSPGPGGSNAAAAGTVSAASSGGRA
ncbi:MAG: 4-hydroxy-tetrahydrodipicolinate synthase [Tepidisphaerales bacterium]